MLYELNIDKFVFIYIYFEFILINYCVRLVTTSGAGPVSPVK